MICPFHVIVKTRNEMLSESEEQSAFGLPVVMKFKLWYNAPEPCDLSKNRVAIQLDSLYSGPINGFVYLYSMSPLCHSGLTFNYYYNLGEYPHQRRLSVGLHNIFQFPSYLNFVPFVKVEVHDLSLPSTSPTNETTSYILFRKAPQTNKGCQMERWGDGGRIRTRKLQAETQWGQPLDHRRTPCIQS